MRYTIKDKPLTVIGIVVASLITHYCSIIVGPSLTTQWVVSIIIAYFNTSSIEMCVIITVVCRIHHTSWSITTNCVKRGLKGYSRQIAIQLKAHTDCLRRLLRDNGFGNKDSTLSRWDMFAFLNISTHKL